MLPSAADQHRLLYAGDELMNGLREYVVGVVAAALLCGIITRLTRNNASGEIVKMLCGVFMTIVVIQPIAGKQSRLWEFTLPDVTRQAEAVSMEGAAAADDFRREFIKQSTEAYILSRAETMGAVIQAEVSLDENCVPFGVRIDGRISPSYRSKLTQIIASELGIPKEQQEWIG